MTELSIKFNDSIERYNILKKPTTCIANFLDTHSTSYKITLIINHLFRVAMMVGIMFIPHVPLLASMSVCFVGSLFYRLTVERNCAYKFALPAFVGAAAFMLALPAIIGMINGTAFVSFASGSKAFASLVPFALYSAYILLTVDYDVNKTLGRLPKEPVEITLDGSEQEKSLASACQCHSKESN